MKEERRKAKVEGERKRINDKKKKSKDEKSDEESGKDKAEKIAKLAGKTKKEVEVVEDDDDDEKSIKSVPMFSKSSNDWSDDNLKKLAHLDLNKYHDMRDSEKAKVLISALESIYKQVSAKTVGHLMMAAWGLVSPEYYNQYIFSKPEMSCKAKDVEDLEDRKMAVQKCAEDMKIPVKDSVKFHYYERTACFMCAATLRLVTKDEKNLARAWDSIMKKYSNFYQESPAFEIVPSVECLKAVRKLLQTRKLLRGSLSWFVLAFLYLEGQEQGLCRLLFEMHMSYTGMHAYSLLMYISRKLCVPVVVLFRVLTHPSLIDALRTISQILVTYEFPIKGNIATANQGRSWKYSRIFDNSAFAAIQTKNCVELVALLATISQKLGGDATSGDATKIKQISGFLVGRKELYELRAEMVIDFIEEGLWDDEKRAGKVWVLGKKRN